MPTIFLNIRVEGFKFVADPRKIRVNRARFNVVCHVYGVEAEGVRCWVNREVVQSAEGDVRVEGRAVSRSRGGINGTPESKSSSMFETLTAPGSSWRLPGARLGSRHNTSTPSVSQGGMKL